MTVIVRMGVFVAACRSRMDDLGQFSLRSQHIDLRRVDAASIDAAQLQFRAKIKRGDGILKHLEWNARIDQRAEKHISADSGEAIQIRNLHLQTRYSPLVGLAPLIAISDAGSSAFIEPERYPSRSSVTYL